MSEEDLNTYKKYVSNLDITKYIVLDSESNYWYSAEYVDEMLKKQDKEIERLNNLLKETSQTLSEQTTKAITLKSENERLNNELKSLQDSYDIEEEQANYHINLTDDLREEVDRLNNIINELEEWLKEKQFERIDNVGIYALYETVLQKLKELKGSDKECN